MKAASDQMTHKPFAPVCPHGSLRRQCEVCDLLERVDALERVEIKYKNLCSVLTDLTRENERLTALLEICERATGFVTELSGATTSYESIK